MTTTNTYLDLRAGRITLSCVLPTYNEAAHLRQFIKHLHDYLTTHLCEVDLEFIIVNDGSKDDTDNIIRTLLAYYPIKYLNFSRNFGKEAALSAGLDHASGQAVLLIDADFQHPVELIPEMLQLWRQSYDMIYGVISDRSHESFLKRLGTRTFYKVINFSKHNRFKIPADAGDFRLLDRAVVDTLKRLPERRRFMKGLYAWVGYKTVAIPFQPKERASGASNFDLHGLLSLASTGMTSFSSFPLRLSALIGTLISVFSMLYGLYIAIDTLIFGNHIRGWTTLAVGLTLFSGIQLVLLGIMGEYVGQIYEEIKQRPLYVVAKKINSPMLTETDKALVEPTVTSTDNVPTDS